MKLLQCKIHSFFESNNKYNQKTFSFRRLQLSALLQVSQNCFDIHYLAKYLIDELLGHLHAESRELDKTKTIYQS